MLNNKQQVRRDVCSRIFPILVLKLGEFIQLVELDKCFIDSVVQYLWIIFYTHSPNNCP